MNFSRIPAPIRGVDENRGEGDQRPDTAHDAKNTRSVDPATGRVRISQREGTQKLITAALGAEVTHLTSITFDQKAIQYDELYGELDSGTPKVSEEWAKDTASGQGATAQDVDQQDNTYTVAGKVIEKRNSSGALLWSFPIPLPSDSMVLGSVRVDTGGNVYTATASGKFQSKSAIYRIRQIPVANSKDTEPELHWSLTVGRWVRELRLYQQSLIALEQDDKTYSALAVTYANLTTIAPKPSSVIKAPYPATCMAVKEDGSIVTGHPEYADRDSNPQATGTTLPLQDWTPEDLEDWENRIWSWYMPEDALEANGAGEPVFSWSDRMGHGRDWRPAVNDDLQITKKAVHGHVEIPEGSKPTVLENRLAGRPGVFFNGKSALISESGGGKDSTSSEQLSAIPNYADGAYAIFIVCRPQVGDAGEIGGAEQRRHLIFQRHNLNYDASHSGYGAYAYPYASEFVSGLALNSEVRSASNPYTFNHYGNDSADENWEGNFVPGAVRAYTSFLHRTGTTAYANSDLNLGSGTYGFPTEGSYLGSGSGTAENAIVISMIHDGGLSSYYESEGTLVQSTGVFTGATFAFHPYRLTTGDTATLTDSAGTVTGPFVVTAKGNSTVTLTTGSLPADGTYTVKVTPQDRDCMTRSLLRVNGVPIDRWESHPMQLSGYDSVGTARILADVVDASPTILGHVFQPEAASSMRPFLGDVYEIIVVKRRKDGADLSEPTILSHPMYGDASDYRGAGEYPEGTWPPTPSGASDDHAYGTTSFVGTASALNTTELERFEGYLAHSWGIGLVLPDHTASFPHTHSRPSFGSLTFDLPISSALQSGPAAVKNLRETDPLLVKQSPAGELIYALVGLNVGGGPSVDINDVAYVPAAKCTGGIELASDGGIYVAGPGLDDDGIVCMAKLTDVDSIQGVSDQELEIKFWWDSTDVSFPHAGTTGVEHACNFASDELVRLWRDKEDNLWVPIPPTATSTNYDLFDCARVFAADGTHLLRLSTEDHGVTAYQNGYCVTVPQNEPEFDADDFTASGFPRAEFATVGLETDDNSTTDPSEALRKFRTALATVLTNTPRDFRYLAIAGGALSKRNGASWASVAGVSFSNTATYLASTTHQQKLYITDGSTYGVYTPKTDLLEAWEATGSGSMPQKCQLITTWLDRVVMARGSGDPHNWHMSAAGDPLDWDNFPPVPNDLMAISGNNADITGLCPDIINTLVPYNDDLLLFGCDSSIYALVSNPVSGGAFDLVSDITGMAFGRSWCKDPSGVLYFFGSKGGVYRMVPGGQPEHLSDARSGNDVSIERRLRDMDLSAYRVELVWDHENMGLRVYLIPFVVGGTASLEFYFWSHKTAAWWPDSMVDAGHQPYSIAVFDGDDPDDRVVAHGCQDGYVRLISKDAKDDDGLPIDSWVIYGPIRTDGDLETKLIKLRAVMAHDLAPVMVQVYVNSSTKLPEEPVWCGEFAPGLSDTLSVRQRGAYVWIKVGNVSAGQRWAIEELSASVSRGGRRRAR